MCFLLLYVELNYSVPPLKIANNHAYIYICIFTHLLIIHQINRLNTQYKQRDRCQNKRAVGVSGGTGGNLFTSFFLLSSFYHFSCDIFTSFLISSSHVSVIHLLSYWCHIFPLCSESSLFIFSPFPHVLLYSFFIFLVQFHLIIFSVKLTASRNNQSI